MISMLLTIAFAAAPRPIWFAPIDRIPHDNRLRFDRYQGMIAARERTGTVGLSLKTGKRLWRRTEVLHRRYGARFLLQGADAVVAVDPRGKTKWRRRGQLLNFMSLERDGRLLIEDGRDTISVDVETGRMLWRQVGARDAHYSGPNVVWLSKGANGQDERVVASPETGRPRWRRARQYLRSCGPVMFTTTDKTVRAFDRMTGKARWGLDHPIRHSVVKAGVLWVEGPPQKINAYDCESGQRLSTFQFESRIWLNSGAWLTHTRQSGERPEGGVEFDPETRRIRVYEPGGALVALDPHRGSLNAWKAGSFADEMAPHPIARTLAGWVGAEAEDIKIIEHDGTQVAAMPDGLIGLSTGSAQPRTVHLRGRLRRNCLKTCAGVRVRVGALQTQTDKHCRFAVKGVVAPISPISIDGEIADCFEPGSQPSIFVRTRDRATLDLRVIEQAYPGLH